MKTFSSIAIIGILSVIVSCSSGSPKTEEQLVEDPTPTPIPNVTGTPTVTPTPTASPTPGPKFTGISAGSAHSCGVLDNGKVMCWGSNGSGQLGAVTMIFPIPRSEVPIEVQNISDAVSVDAGGKHTCAVVQDGRVFCWGDNAKGQLGDGTDTPSIVPVEVPGLTGVQEISLGYEYSCALIAADGSVRCWGDNSFGQLGDADGGNPGDKSLTPVPVLSLSGATHIAMGNFHGCALLTDMSAVCWGFNSEGQLGDGSIINAIDPVPVTGLSNAVDIDAGLESSCAVLSDGQVKCWGSNSSGKLGTGDSIDSTVPDRPVVGLTDVIRVVAGAFHACALRQGGAVLCWGDNQLGELGNGTGGTVASSDDPVSVTGLSNVAAFSSLNGHIMAIRTDGKVFGWGYNSLGQVGLGFNGATDAPVPLANF